MNTSIAFVSKYLGFLEVRMHYAASNNLDPCSSKCGPWSNTWAFDRTAEARLQPRPAKSEPAF